MRALGHIVVTVLLASGALAATAALAPPAAEAAKNVPAGTFSSGAAGAAGSITISGKGFGHGVGLAQDGDLALGREGKTMPQILGYFYPGTRFGTIGDTMIRAAVVEVDGTKPIDITLPAGGVVRVGTSGVTVAKNGVARLTHGGGGYVVKLLNPPKHVRADTVSAHGDTPYSVYSGGLEQVGDSSYHGVLTVVADGKKLRAVNALPIETYLDGLGEVRDPSWPQASLQALVVAARSYALHSLHPGALFDVWSDDRSQVYLGAGAEYDALTEAVAKTRGLVLTYDGSVADTVYSASGGGVTATAAEGFGDDATVAANEPYLTAGKYPTANPLPWAVTYSLATVGAALAYPGTLTGVSVTSVGPSGRAIGVTLTGSSGRRLVPGLALYHDLLLQSNLYTLATATSSVTPTAAIPTSTTIQGAGPTVPAANPPGASGTATPPVVTGGSASAQLPTPSATAAVPAAKDVPVPANLSSNAPSNAPDVASPAATRVLASAVPATSPGTPVRFFAISLWALAVLTFAGFVLRRHRAAGST